MTLSGRNDAVAMLLTRSKFGAGLGLHRMQALMNAMPRGLWRADGRSIHVVGSQGKGTVTTLVAALLATLGYRTGRFISPHLLRFEERIAIAGQDINGEALTAAVQRFAAFERDYLAAHPADSFGAFEAITAAAFFAFSAGDVDVAVLEAGIGGRFDSTRAAGGDIIALTGIDREHGNLLGPTEEHILYDKVDLCPSGGLVIAAPLPPALMVRLGAYGTVRGFDILYADDFIRIEHLRHTSEGALADITVADVTLEALQTRLYGAPQMGNSALAIAIVREWLHRKGQETSTETLAEAARVTFAQTAPPLRFERLADDPPTIADVAHTPAAARALAETTRAVLGPSPLVLLIGIADSKPAGAILDALAPLAIAVVCTKSHRGIAPEVLASLIPARTDRRVHIAENPVEAFALATELARDAGTALLVTGSAHLAADAKCIAAGQDPAALERL